MKFKSKAQAQAYEQALQRDYQAAAFDVDGTLTEMAKLNIPAFLLSTLEKIPLDIPLALCTGRPIDFLHHKMEVICRVGDNPSAQRRRWWILAENGGAGYYYDAQAEGYVPFFEVPWPDEVEKEVLEAHLKDRLGWHIDVLVRKHSVVAVYPRWMYLFPRIVQAESRRNSRKIIHLLKERGWDTVLMAQNSGLGTLIIPKTSGKGNAIRRMARRLGIPMKSILSVGDSPQEGGNDEDFLSGDFGTPFSVGPVPHDIYPLPVLDERGVHVRGPKGTDLLLKRLFGSTK